MAKIKDPRQTALDIVAHAGGEENIVSVEHCMTRLRFQLKDYDKADTEAIKRVAGVIQVVDGAGQYQVIIGPEVGSVFESMMAETHIKGLVNEEVTAAAEAAAGGKRKFDIFSLIADLFLPAFYGVIGSSVIKGFLLLFSSLGVISDSSTTYQILDLVGTAALTYLPVLLAVTAAKRFGANVFISLVVAVALCSPELAAMTEGVTLFGIPISMISYTNSVFPIIAAVFFQGYVERFLNKYLPSALRSTFTPTITLFVVMCATLLVIGPVLSFLTNILAGVISFLIGLNPVVAAFIIGAAMPFLQIFGLHYAMLPLVLYNFATYGYDTVSIMSIGLGTAIVGSLLAVALKTKREGLKETAFSTSFVALTGGITEPGIYGVLLKQKRLYIACAIVSGLGGAWLTFNNAQLTAFLSWNVFTYPAFIAMFGMPMLVYIIWLFVAGFGVSYFLYDDAAMEE